MSAEAQKVVVIQDASRDVSSSLFRWVLSGLSFKPGDELTLLGVLHQVNNPSTLPFMGAGKLLGYKSKVDYSSLFGANQRIVVEEVARKKEAYRNKEEIMQIAKQCKMEKIKFHIEVHAGPTPRMIAVEAAKNLGATWVILDRQMKKDKKYFMDRLSCGISRMKRDNTIEKLREPKAIGNTKLPTERSSGGQITYDEMLPGSPEEELSQRSPSPPKTSLGKEHGGDIGGGPKYRKSTSFSTSSSSEQLLTTTTVSSSSLVNTEASSSSFTEAKCSPFLFQEEENTTNTEHETAEEQSPVFITESQERGRKDASNTGSPDEEQKQHSSNDDWMGGCQPEESFENSICSVCENRRPKIGWKREFNYAELQAATEGFSPKNFLSEGGFGSVYRGKLKNGLTIAVKQHKNASFQGEKEFKSEVHVLSKARHKNLVMLLGSCSEGSHRLLVYEYVCNGSLDQHLSKHSRRPLSWEKRMKIAMGAAKGLEYLHENNIIHRDMRPNNILVTHDHESLLGDFGLARTQREDSDDHSSETRVVGTFGYLAPEYAESGKVSTKTDVFSFGVVLLQLITGLRTTDKILGGKSLVGWARPLLKERNYPDLIDPRIVDSHDVHQLFWMVRVAEKCLSKDPHKRLPMEKVVSALNYIMEGNTVCSINDFSPAQSDSVGSVPESSESQDGTTEQESFSTKMSSISSTSEMSGMPSTSAATHTVSTRRSSIPPSFGQSTLGSGRSQEKRSKTGVLYDEMIK